MIALTLSWAGSPYYADAECGELTQVPETWLKRYTHKSEDLLVSGSILNIDYYWPLPY